METVNMRIATLIESEKLNKNTFAQKIGVTANTIGYIVGERQSKPGFEVIEKIAVAYPDVNMDWLIRGTGPIRKSLLGPPNVIWTLLGNERVRYGELLKLHGSLNGDYDLSLSALQTATQS
ncbi:hypothetical protein [Hymenobacter sp. YC55]|uniref:hypothetical protein n=1 Tax=Hymenobacter sp. YC55 TaxID=3034019 RepID=UPI0023F71455|nr:hypothetical protein [Hymenobacter sp. YC55]MDF7810703.1 hypothetical protein [Hymenobacter sp. YC55]